MTYRTRRKRDYHQQYHRRQYWIGKIKRGFGCSDCGYSAHACALDFDHRDPADKEFLIPRYIGRTTLRRLFKEIRKCRVLCANCHRVHSRTQWNDGTTYKVKGTNAISI